MIRCVLLPVLFGGCDVVLGLGGTTFAGDSDARTDAAELTDAGPDACTGPSCGQVFASCRVLRDMFPTAPSGVYAIDAGTGPFTAYCEQVEDSGGWTLALKADGRTTTFAYDEPIWENATLLATDQPNLDHVEAKLETFNAIAFTELRVGLEFPIDSGQIRWLVVPLAAAKLAELFIAQHTTTLGRDAWKSLMGASASLQLNCNLEGTNLFHEFTRVRIGILSNQEDECLSPDSRIGIGGGGIVCGSPTQSAGNTACFDPDNGIVELPAFGWVLVR